MSDSGHDVAVSTARDLSSFDDTGAQLLFRFVAAAYERRAWHRIAVDAGRLLYPRAPRATRKG